MLKPLFETWFGLVCPGGGENIPLKLAGDFTLLALEDCFLGIPGGVVLEVEAGRWPICVGEVVLVIEPLLMKEAGRSPNLGKLNWKSLPFP